MKLPLYFNYSPKDIKNIEYDIIKTNNEWLEYIKKEINKLTPLEFLESYIYNFTKFDYIPGTISFLKYVSDNEEVRQASVSFDLNLKKYSLDFFKSIENYKLFLILKKIKFKKNGIKDIHNTKKLIKNILKSFEDNGVHLQKEKKEDFIKINNKLMKLENDFSQNIANGTIIIKFKKSELLGIEENILKTHLKKENIYSFDTSYPDNTVIMRDCEIRKTREKMYISYNSIAKKNLPILKDILELRNKRSHIFDFKDSVSYYMDDNRIATKEKIEKLLLKLIPILTKKYKYEYKKILETSNIKELYDYDLSYYTNIYKKKYLDLNEKIIKTYFPSNYSINKIFEVYSDIFRLKIDLVKAKKENYWNKDVTLYKVSDSLTKELLGYLYLDLYPRKNKYNHAATFDIQNSYRNKDGKRIIPVTTIVCNFSVPTSNNNFSLFTFGEITTFCHEFGHALHFILSNAKYKSLSGISLEDDFAEMPSQFFENFCYNKEFLQKISYNYESGKCLPDTIIKNIQKNQNYNIAIHYLTQILYIKYDLDIHQLKDNITEKYLHNHWFELRNKLFPHINYNSNTYPMCRFDHLIGYASLYYGYLWSIIYSYDAYSVFEKEGVFNKNTGLRFRKEILEKGSTLKSLKMLENFLKRKSSPNSFFRIFK
jgi:thimet oligopeptidase